MLAEQKGIWKNLLVAVVGAVVGAVGTYFWNVKLAERMPYFEERQQGYSQFFEGHMANWTAIDLRRKLENMSDGEERRRIENKIDEYEQRYYEYAKLANFRIAIFGGSQVVNAMAIYFLKNWIKKDCDDIEKYQDDVNIYQEVRLEMSASGNVSDRNMAAVIVQCRLPK